MPGPKRAPSSEAALVTSILKWLRSDFGGYWQKNWSGTFAVSGRPDIEGCYRDRFFAIECKAPGRFKDPIDGLSEAQAETIREIRAAGGVVIVTDNLNDVKAVMGALR